LVFETNPFSSFENTSSRCHGAHRNFIFEIFFTSFCCFGRETEAATATSLHVSRFVSISSCPTPRHFIDLENQFEVQDAESRVEGEEDPDERGRRFTLTDSNYESTKENEKSGSNLLPSQGMGSGSSAGLSTAAQHYLKSLPDFSFMLVAPSVENGKE
jgi:hypothetical protein